MSLRDLGLDGVALHPKVGAVLTKLVLERDELKKRKRHHKAQIANLKEEQDRLTSHTTILESTLRETTDALNEARVRHHRQATALARKNARLSQRVRYLESIVSELHMEKDGLTQAVEKFIEDSEARGVEDFPPHRSVIHHTHVVPYFRHEEVSTSVNISLQEEYAASLISSLARRLDATHDAMDMLEQDSGTSIAILEARVADREARLFGDSLAAEHQNQDRSVVLMGVKRQFPAEASRVSNPSVHGGRQDLEEEVKQIASRLEEAQASASRIVEASFHRNILSGNILDVRPVTAHLDPPNFPSETMDIPEPGNTLELEVEHEPSTKSVSPRFSPKSPRMKLVLRDLDAEIGRLTRDLGDLKMEREAMLLVAREAPQAGFDPNHDERRVDLDISTAAVAGDTDVQEPSSPLPHPARLLASPGDRESSSHHTDSDVSGDNDEESENNPSHRGGHIRLVDAAALRQQFLDAQAALLAKESQLRKLQNELQDLLVDQHG